MTEEEIKHYSQGTYPLFELMTLTYGLNLVESELLDIIDCVRKMDEAGRIVNENNNLNKY